MSHNKVPINMQSLHSLGMRVSVFSAVPYLGSAKI